MTPQSEAMRLLDESLAANEASKGSLLTAVQKLSRAAALLENQDVQKWCSVQLGDHQYTAPLRQFLAALQLKDGNEKKSSCGGRSAKTEGSGAY